jgi:hypothetical protein
MKLTLVDNQGGKLEVELNLGGAMPDVVDLQIRNWTTGQERTTTFRRVRATDDAGAFYVEASP